MSTVKLADKLSDLLWNAVSDLRAVVSNPQYQVTMALYHKPCQGRCYVCLAGSVMARTLAVDPTKTSMPWDFSLHNHARLQALDNLRLGEVTPALQRIGEYNKSFRDVDVCEYDFSPGLFMEQMEELAENLRLEGL